MERLKKTVDMTEGPFLGKMIKFAIPLIITGLLQTFYNAADLIVVGQFRGDVAVAAVGSTGSLTNLILGLFMGLAVGAGVLVAQYIGAKEYGEVKKVVHTSVIISVLIGVIMALVGFLFSGKLLELMGTPEEVLPHATLYMKIIFLGTPASLLYNYIASMLRSVGDSKRPLIFLSISGAVNVVFNVILVLCGLGVDGVAISTILSQYLSAIMALVYLCRTSGPLRLSRKDMKINVKKLKRILYIGIPSGIQGSLFSFSNVLIQSSINSFGDNVVAGSAATANLEGFVYIAMNAIYHVALTFIGQNVGARKYKNIKKLTLYSSIIVTVVGLVSGLLIVLFRDSLIGLYVSEEAAISTAMARMWIIMPTYFLCGLMEVFCGALRALDRSVTAMVISLCGACGLRIFWIQTIFRLFPSPESIFVSYPVSWTLTAGAHLIFVIVATRKLIKRSREELALLEKQQTKLTT